MFLIISIETKNSNTVSLKIYESVTLVILFDFQFHGLNLVTLTV